MPSRLNCSRCGCPKLYSVRRGKRKCSACGYEWTPGRLPLYLSRSEWTKILHWFLRGLPAAAIAQETGLERKRVLRALTYVIIALKQDIPDVFSGVNGRLKMYQFRS